MKQLPKINAALVSLLAFCVVCFGQAGASTSRSSPPNAPQPAPEIQSLEKAFVGKWSTTYHFEPGGMSPREAPARAKRSGALARVVMF